MGKRLLPKIIRKWTQLTWWGETPEGYTIYRDENNAGGHRYWSDEIGGGVIVWDTSLVSPETLAYCLDMEKGAASYNFKVSGIRSTEVPVIEEHDPVDDEPVTFDDLEIKQMKGNVL